jgi:hypothetical protein
VTRTPVGETLIIPGRFNGPPQSANGGYTCGLVSTVVEGVVEVTLRSPPPLDVELEVVRTADGVEVLDGTTLVATARQVSFEPLEIPQSPTWDEAEAASQGYLGHLRHEFPTCFTCGTDRTDGLEVFPGPTATGLVASPWTPNDSLPNSDGILAKPIVWAALDCPGASADARDLTEHPVVLGRMAAVVHAPVTIGRRYVAVAWKLGEEGRKSFAATALIDDEGQAVAIARQTWIAVPSSK